MRNFLLNLAGRLLPFVLSLLVFPFVVRHLGVESYGIVGIVGSILALAGILDLAFSQTINRELALHPSMEKAPPDLGEAVVTLEVMAWLAGVVLCLALLAGTPLLQAWIGSGKYDSDELSSATRWMAILALIQIPSSFYGGCLFGLQRHALNNGATLLGAVLGSALSVYLVTLPAATVGHYLLGQLLGRVVSLLAMVVGARLLLSRNGLLGTARFRWSSLSRSWSFAVGMNGLGFLNLAANQVDLVLASRLLAPIELGYYTIARTVTQSFVGPAMAAYQAAFPELTAQLGRSDDGAFRETFHRYAQLITLALVPAALVLGTFCRPILSAWTQDDALAQHTEPLVRILLAGAVAYGMGVVFSAVQMAHAALRGLFATSTMLLVATASVGAVAAGTWQGHGVALGRLTGSIAALLVALTICARYYLSRETARWFRQDFCVPVVAALLAVLAVRSTMQTSSTLGTSTLAAIAVASMTSLGATAWSLPVVRKQLARTFRRSHPHNESTS